ncbi:GPI mannosyltransferase 1 [Trichinella nativa]|uniref:GPI alpha-1,4-mannosyltransferase I, catalytic subunit n=1 Tax=Trichinella nativa TaxID=6335 RepID=A0A0V1LJN9_9BILA|nr:GPI mannosyltransferase 1 [Trichinella nativa]
MANLSHDYASNSLGCRFGDKLTTYNHGSSKMTDSTIYRIGIYGWRKRCLYAMILLLIVLIVANITVTFWIMSIMGFTLDGIGGMRISKAKIEVTGEAEFVNAVYLQRLSSASKVPMFIESDRAVLLTARDKTGNISSRLVLKDNQIQAICDRFEVVNRDGKAVFSATENEVAVRVENLRIISEGGSVFDGSIQTSVIRPEADMPLLLESPTRGMEVRVAQDIEILSRAGDVKAEALHNIVFQSANGEDYFFDVKFTDVDYTVMLDAAKLMARGQSPYERQTYRYTPTFAWLLLPAVRWPLYGKLLFNAFDLLAGLTSTVLALSSDFGHSSLGPLLALALFNPFTMIISSRGNAESFVSFLVLFSLLLVEIGGLPARLCASLFHGFCVHVKIYPIIYLPSACFKLYQEKLHQKDDDHVASRPVRFARALGAAAGYAFGVLVGFVAPTALAYYKYGRQYADEALLYHLRRTDYKHNFSPFFLPLYLNADSSTNIIAWISYAAFVPQALIVLFLALKFARQLPICWFISTLAFVAHNKVCTSQYFVWYLAFLPTVWSGFDCDRGRPVRLLLWWTAGQALWLLPAYCLEFRGFNFFLPVWIASVLFFLINVHIIRRAIVSFR